MRSRPRWWSAKESYAPTNVNIAPQVAALKASGAQVSCRSRFPAFTALLKLYSLKLSFNPTLAVSNVGSDPITLGGLVSRRSPSRAARPSTAAQ